MLDMIERPSPNHNERQLPVSIIVLHYTGMPTAEAALDKMTSEEGGVCKLYHFRLILYSIFINFT